MSCHPEFAEGQVHGMTLNFALTLEYLETNVC
jgi:hypothetical protein